MSLIQKIQSQKPEQIVLKQAPVESSKNEKEFLEKGSKKSSEVSFHFMTKNFKMKEWVNSPETFRIQQQAIETVKKMIADESSHSAYDVLIRGVLEQNTLDYTAKVNLLVSKIYAGNYILAYFRDTLVKIKDFALEIKNNQSTIKNEIVTEIKDRINKKLEAIKTAAIEELSRLEIPPSEIEKVKAKLVYDINQAFEKILKTQPEEALLQKLDGEINKFLEQTNQLANKLQEAINFAVKKLKETQS